MKKVIQTMLDAETIKQLEKDAKNKGHTISSLIRHIIKTYLEKSENHHLPAAG